MKSVIQEDSKQTKRDAYVLILIEVKLFLILGRV